MGVFLRGGSIENVLPIEYVLPLLCGFIYALAGIFSKRAFAEGAGVARTFVAYNWIQCFFFIPLLFFQDAPADWSQGYWAVLAGLCFFAGQLMTFAAIRAGDVSVQSPVMGTKMLFVAVFAALLGVEVIPASWWWGALFGTLGVILLSYGKVEQRKRVALAVVLALLGSASFALCDVLVAQHARAFSSKVFPVIMVGVTALLSLGIIPFFRESFQRIQPAARLWFVLGGLAFAVQCFLIYVTLSTFGNATAFNILYATRGVWSVVLVWLLGSWLGNRESSTVGTAGMVRRLLGAACMLVAIGLVFLA